LTPDQGQVRLGVNLTVGYFDQMRARLEENVTVADTISPGSEWVEIGDQRKHIMSYLEDFLFSPARAHSPVSSLSGGERARLVLARLFARPTNVLVMDEPTNDLDIETLELLEALLQDYQGTVLLVSHDREFLNNVVTQTLAFEGNGRWREYVGGYDEWLAQRPALPALQPAGKASGDESAQGASDDGNSSKAGVGQEPSQAARKKPSRPGRLASWEQKELDDMPDAIAAIEAKQAELAARLADGSLYRDAPDEVDEINRELQKLEDELASLFERWETLEGKQAG